jgi:dUTP pyrophosphatase
MKPIVKFKKLNPNAVIPQYKTAGAAGMDLVYCDNKPINLIKNQPYLVPTGIAVEIPEGYEGQIRPRSGLACKGVMIMNSPGTIDCDYRGEVMVILTSMILDLIDILPGDRIAQLVITPVVQAELQEVTELSSTDRGTGGFGSTGK